MSEDEIDQKISEGTIDSQFFGAQILRDTEEAKQMLREVQDRQNDIKKIEDSLRLLLDMFNEMATLVSTQVGIYLI